ncbi:MAG: aldo/keto reductase [Propionibacteriaceae bacterium]|jgi:2,5-diketo-D-gluconate reductase A|nr:aldo/keto reductase [Propionibacteriaceae bacterium]
MTDSLSSALAPTITLARGAVMPMLGLGTWPMDDAEAAVAVKGAINAGYRLVDTAENYGNEIGVGHGVNESDVRRGDLFVTTKFNKEWHSVEGARAACLASMERLGLDYLDLLLIHWPNPQQGAYVEAWKGLLKLREEGLIKAAGVSNFKVDHLRRLLEETGELPEVNQINLNPYAQRRDVVAYHAEHGVVTEAWSPIKPAAMLDDPVITGIAAAHERTPAQVALRWITQHGYVTVPKSSSRQRQTENLAIFDFTLSDEEMAAIDGLDRGDASVVDSDKNGH